MTQAEARLILRLADAQQADAAAAALAPENGPHCRMSLEGDTLVVDVKEARLGSVAVTVDDLLACLSAAARAWEGAEARGPTSEG